MGETGRRYGPRRIVVAAGVAAVGVAASLVWRVHARAPGSDASQVGTAKHLRPSRIERVSVPTDWQGFPIVASGVTWTRVGELRENALALTGVRTREGTIGGVPLSVEENVCTAGGSACLQSPANYHRLRVGDADGLGGEVAAGPDCEADPSFLQQSNRPYRTCDLQNLALRHTQSEGVYVLTMKDHDEPEHTLAAFTYIER